jgi:hypothetical protein
MRPHGRRHVLRSCSRHAAAAGGAWLGFLVTSNPGAAWVAPCLAVGGCVPLDPPPQNRPTAPPPSPPLKPLGVATSIFFCYVIRRRFQIEGRDFRYHGLPRSRISTRLSRARVAHSITPIFTPGGDPLAQRSRDRRGSIGSRNVRFPLSAPCVLRTSRTRPARLVGKSRCNICSTSEAEMT